jgi:hypothetical protein
MKEKTELARTDMNGQPIVPGDLETEAKLTLSSDEGFAFLNLLPDDIQPAIVGDYDFIANPSSEQLNDPIALQQNFFLALDKVTTPEWIQGLASSGKKLNYAKMTDKVFDKLNIGIDEGDILEDNTPAPVGPDQLDNQPNPMEAMMGTQVPQGNPMQELLDQEGGQNGGTNGAVGSPAPSVGGIPGAGTGV